MSSVGVVRRVQARLPTGTASAARDQVVVAGGQVLSGVGNMAFALVLARVLAPGSFAQLASFLALYTLLSLPGSSISAAASLASSRARRARRTTFASGAAIGGAVALASPWIGPFLRLPTAMVIVLGLSGPALGTLALERGRLYGERAHHRLVASFVAEPAVRLTIGVVLALATGAVGGALGVTLAGYGALEIARRATRRLHARTEGAGSVDEEEPSDRPVLASEALVRRDAETARPSIASTATAFLLLAVVQNQDLLIANRVLSPAAAGQFAVISTLGGLAAFATLTVPLVLLPRTARGDRGALLPALGLTSLLGGGALGVALLAPHELVVGLFGARYAGVTGLAAPYLLAMALLGVARVLAAHSCAHHSGRSATVLVAAAGVLQAMLILDFGHSPRAVSLSTLTATSTLTFLLGGLVVVRAPSVRRWWGSVGETVVRWRAAAVSRPMALFVGGALVAGTALRFVVPRGLWLDEASSVHQARMSFGAMLNNLRTTDVHPPLYFSVLWVGVRVLGSGELAVRAPSIIAGVLTIPVLYLLGKEAYDRRTGAVAALLGIVSPILVWYSQEARMYSMLALFGLIAMWAQVRILKRHPLERVGWLPWVVYALASAAMVWTQYFGLLQLAVQQIAFLGAIVVRHRQGHRVRQLVWGWGITAFVIVAALAPLVPFAYTQFAINQTAGKGFGAPSQVGTAASLNGNHVGVYAALANLVWAVLGYQPNSTMLLLGALWPLGMLFSLALLGRRRQSVTTLIVAAILGPGVALYTLGIVKPFLFDVRYLFPAVALLDVLIARVVTGMFRNRRMVGIVTMSMALVFGGFLVNQQVNGSNPRRYDFNTALAQIDKEDHPGDTLQYVPEDLGLIVDYYSPHVEAESLGPHPVAPTAHHVVWVLASRELFGGSDDTTLAEALEVLRRHSRTVAVHRYANVEVWTFK